MKKIIIHTDGGSRGNPGPAAIGISISDEDNKEIKKIKSKIGVSTNNVAEYIAVLTALEWLHNNYRIIELSNCRIEFFLDSLLAVNQLNGIFKIKDPNLKKFIIRIKNMEKDFSGGIRYVHIPREENKIADGLVNDALDNN